MGSLLKETKVNLHRVLQVVEVFRVLDADMPIGMVTAFLITVLGETEDGGITITELRDRGEFSLTAASRYAQVLGDLARKKVLKDGGLEDTRGVGLQLIQAQPDRLDNRRKILRTTAKGRRITSQIEHALGV